MSSFLVARTVGGAQVGYKDESKVFKCRVEKTNAIVNALNRTKREEHPDLAALQEERAKEYRRYDIGYAKIAR